MKISKLSLVAVLALGMAVPAFASEPATTSDKPAQSTQPAKTEKGEKGDKGYKSDKGDKKDADKKSEGVTVGSMAPQFTLTDTDGKEISLSQFAGKVVVLQWFNPGCPFVVKHYNGASTFNDLNKKYSDKGVVFLAINSGAPGKQGAGKDTNVSAKKDWNIGYPVLLDESGKVGKMYGAQRTPEMFIINKDGTLAYHGAIDDDNSAKGIGKTNYVAKALDEILAGKPVSTPTTKPYGCTVKY